MYCPDSPVTRAQMAVFLVRGIHGTGFSPPAAAGSSFADVLPSHPLLPWMEQLLADGITGGCATDPLRYCADQSVTRGHMAVFLLRAKYGAGHQPPPAKGIFADVPTDHRLAPWVEQLFAEGITSGCGIGPLRYCLDQPLTRAQMAVFLVRVFNL